MLVLDIHSMENITQESPKENPGENQPSKKVFVQGSVSEEVRARLRVAAAIRGGGMSEIITELALKHLPPVPPLEIEHDTPDE